MAKCKKVDFYRFILGVKSMEKYELRAKKVEGVLKTEPSTLKATVKVEVKAR